MENLYPILAITNKSIGYIENISFTNLKWIQNDITMHPPINILVNFNDFIENNNNYKTKNYKASLKMSYQ
jgi:hypothetical protein